MVRVNLLVYSDRKIALELNVHTEMFSLPSIDIDKRTKKSIREALKHDLGMSIEDFTELENGIKKRDSSLYLLIGEWEGLLKTKSNEKRYLWYEIKDAIEKVILDEQKKVLDDFRKAYREVVSPSNENIGIAPLEECRKCRLSTKNALMIVEDNEGRILLKREKGGYSSLLSSQMLGESPEEASYRLLMEEFGMVTELRKLKTIQNYSEKERFNTTILEGSYEQSLTLLKKEAEKCVFLAKNEVMERINSGKASFPEGFSNAFKAYMAVKSA